MRTKMMKTVCKAVALSMTVGTMLVSNGMVANAEGSYTVKKDDYLKKIAQEAYGDASKWESIYEANKDNIKNPNLIYEGQVFILPDNADVATVPAAETSAVETPTETDSPTEATATQANFEKYGLVCNSKLNTTYPYVIPCYDREYTTNGKVTFSDYKVFGGDETHEALDGYEWRAVTCTVVFDDENAYNHGYSGIGVGTTDYYNDSFLDNYKEKKVSFSATYNGIEYTGMQYDREVLFSDWDDSGYTYKFRELYRVPINYDGVVLAIYNPTVDWSVSKTNKDTLFFRLK